MTDPRIVYGARCTWWDSISQAGTTGPGPGGHRLPACPHCGSPLFEVPSEKEWWDGAYAHQDKGHPGYVAMLNWSRGRCYPDFDALERHWAEVAP